MREMCPAMPGNMQEAVVEARAQLQAEAKLKDVCRQLNIPVPLITVTPTMEIPAKLPPQSESRVPKETITAPGVSKSAETEGETAQTTSSGGGPR